MNWEAIGAIGEIIGALAVVISLVYLGLQIRTQNNETRISSVHDILEALRNEVSTFKNSENAALYVKGTSDFDCLSDAEQLQYIAMCLGPLRVWEEAYLQYVSGRLGENTWNALRAQYVDTRSAAGPERVWQLRKHTFSNDFRQYSDALEKGVYLTK